MGQYEHSIDPKNRINFPAKFREQLGENFILTVGLDECIAVYSAEEWDKLEQKINQLPMSRGRSVKLPPHLREYAHLEKDVIVTGASDHAEIWDVERWQSYIGHLTSESVAEELDSLEF